MLEPGTNRELDEVQGGTRPVKALRKNEIGLDCWLADEEVTEAARFGWSAPTAGYRWIL